jgi:N-acetylmuramoyl-L-alanine amidase
MKYLISVGHTATGQTGCGAVGFLNESNCTREIAPLVVSKLQTLGYEVVKLQIDNSDQYDYVKRTNQANSIGGDMFVEIHLNAGGGTGCEVYTTSGSKASSYAEKVSQCISKELGIVNRGYKTSSNLYVLKNTSMPAMLIECCFVDNQTDYNCYNAEKIANAIVQGLTGQTVTSSESSSKCYVVTNYLPYAYNGYDGVDIEYILSYFKGVKCYVRGNDKGVWIERRM